VIVPTDLMPSHRRTLDIVERLTRSVGRGPSARQVVRAYGGGRRGERLAFEGLRSLERRGLIEHRDGLIIVTGSSEARLDRRTRRTAHQPKGATP